MHTDDASEVDAELRPVKMEMEMEKVINDIFMFSAF